jgi:hypothetical protein
MRYARRRFARMEWVLLLMSGVLTFCEPSLAATVTLKDGTVIRGEVKSLQDGVYTVQSESAGTLHIRSDQIRSIDEAEQRPTASAASPSGTPPSGASAVDAAKSLISQDPNLLTAVLGLQSEPEVIAALADPVVAKAIADGNYAALATNPKIVALMQNPKVRAIIEALQ